MLKRAASFHAARHHKIVQFFAAQLADASATILNTQFIWDGAFYVLATVLPPFIT